MRVGMASQLVSLREQGCQVLGLKNWTAFGVVARKAERGVVRSSQIMSVQDGAADQKRRSRKIVKGKGDQRALRMDEKRSPEYETCDPSLIVPPQSRRRISN